MGKGSLTKSTSQPSPSLGSKGGTYSPPPNQGGQPSQFGPSDMMYRGGQPSLDMMYRGGPETQQQKVFRNQRELNTLEAQNQARQYQPQPSYTTSPETTIGHFGMDEYGRGFGQGFMGPPPDQGGQPSRFNMGPPQPSYTESPETTIGHFGMDEYGRGFGQGFMGPPPDQGGQPSRFNMGPPNSYRGPNPYAMPFENRYVQQFRPTPAPFVPVSARDYVSPFQVSPPPVPRPTSRLNLLRGKGGSSQPVRGEQTYFNRSIETAPAPAPASDPAPAYGPSYPIDYVSVGGASGGVVKSAAGRYLQGAGDGTSDSIPATIGGVQPARLADGEFVIDARTVSEIGNGSSNAGAKKLYAMMERVHNERKKAKRGQNTNADRFLPR